MPLVSVSWVRVLSASALLAVAAAAHAGGDAARGAKLAYTCLGCHGIDNYKNVYPTYSVPRLAGQHPEYLAAALKEYRSGERSHATMHAQASALSDQDIDDVAAYLAGQPVTSGTQPPRGATPAKVTEVCAACHGKDGVGITADYPTLAGQHPDYIARALRDYQKGSRKNAIMPAFASQLNDAEIEEVAAYFSTQQPALQTVHRRETFLAAK